MPAVMIPGVCERMGAEYVRAALKFVAVQDEILAEWGKGPLRDMEYLAELTAVAHRLKHNYGLHFEDLPKCEKITGGKKYTVTREA